MYANSSSGTAGTGDWDKILLLPRLYPVDSNGTIKATYWYSPGLMQPHGTTFRYIYILIGYHNIMRVSNSVIISK